MMDNQSMREMNKDELIANLSLNDLADIIIMERQHIRELRQRNDKLVEMLQEQISDLTHKLAKADRALELALEYFALLDNDIHKYKLRGAYGIFLHDDFCKAKWITKAMQEDVK